MLEFLLINHPLDCPVCDKGGECPLQDQTLAYGPGESRFVEEKRHFEKPIPVSDVVLLDRERCILCDRCTRFAKEVAGDPLIHFMDRGNQTQVNTFPDHPFASYFSGNTVQICPVGALTATPYRFKARPWDLDQVESTCTSCSVGLPGRGAVEPQPGAALPGRRQRRRQLGLAVRQGALRLRGRQQRGPPGQPAGARRGPVAQGPPWNDACAGRPTSIRQGLDRSGPEGLAVIGGARLTNEDQYAWVKLTKGLLGSDNIDAQLGDGLPAEAVLGLPRATDRRRLPPGGRGAGARARHQGGAAGPVPAAAPRGAQRRRQGWSSWPRPRTGLTDELARLPRCATARATPCRSCGRCWRATDRRRRGRGHARGHPGGGGRCWATARSPSSSAGPTWPSRADRSRRPPRPSTTPGPTCASSARCAGPTSTAPSSWACRRGCCPARVTLDGGREWFAERWPDLPTAKGLDTAGILRAAADGKIDTLVLLGADPLADFPDRDLAERGPRRRPHGHRPRPVPHRVGQAGRRGAAGRRLRRGRRHHHQPRGPGQHAGPEGHGARARPSPTGWSPPSWRTAWATTWGSSRPARSPPRSRHVARRSPGSPSTCSTAPQGQRRHRGHAARPGANGGEAARRRRRRRHRRGRWGDGTRRRGRRGRPEPPRPRRRGGGRQRPTGRRPRAGPPACCRPPPACRCRCGRSSSRPRSTPTRCAWS